MKRDEPGRQTLKTRAASWYRLGAGQGAPAPCRRCCCGHALRHIGPMKGAGVPANYSMPP